jgi:acyl-CoA synthetase
MDNGAEVWRADLGGKVFASPHGVRLTAHLRAVAAATVPGRVLLLNAADGATLAETQLDGEVFSSPVCYKGDIYVGCRDDHVHCFRVVSSHVTRASQAQL